MADAASEGLTLYQEHLDQQAAEAVGAESPTQSTEATAEVYDEDRQQETAHTDVESADDHEENPPAVQGTAESDSENTKVEA
jgi:hypothetical protein